MSVELEQRIAALEDRAAITDLMVRYAWGLDLPDWDLYGSTLSDEIEVDLGDADLGLQTWSRETWCDFAAQALGRADAAQHLAANFWIELDGDRATCRSALFAQSHLAGAPGGDERVHRGMYDCEVRRIDGEWRIAKLATRSWWMSGNKEMFPEATKTSGKAG